MGGRRRDARDETGPVLPVDRLSWPLPDQQRISVEVPGSAASLVTQLVCGRGESSSRAPRRKELSVADDLSGGSRMHILDWLVATSSRLSTACSGRPAYDGPQQLQPLGAELRKVQEDARNSAARARER